MFEVLEHFKDLKDDRHEYNPGDIFPREGLTVSEDRIKELSTSNNKRGRAVIKEVMPMPKEPVVEEPKEEPKKRGRKRKNAD